MANSAARLAQKIAELERRLQQVERGPRLSNASMHGAPLLVYAQDDPGIVRQIIGTQPDGSITVVDTNGPPPPVPSLPIVEEHPGTLVVTWDGTFADGVPAPADWDHVEVHRSTVSGYTTDDATEVTTIHSLKGGSVTLALDAVPQYIVLQAVNTSRVESAPTAEVRGTPAPVTIDPGGVKTYHEDEPPVGLTIDDEGSLWIDTNNGNLMSRWDGARAAWTPVPVGTGAIDTGAVTSVNTQYRPGGGMLSNLIPDPEFIDPAWRSFRTENEGWNTWTFAQVPQNAPGTLAGYTFGAKVTGNSVTIDGTYGARGALQVRMTINTALVAGDLLAQSAAMPVTGSRTYRAHLEMNGFQSSWTIVVEWLTSASVLISTTPLTGFGDAENVVSPSNAAFARFKVNANAAVVTGPISALGVGFFLGGAGVEPGDWTAGITFPSTAQTGDLIYLVRNVPISRVQDYYADITGISTNCDVTFILREYEANGDYTDSWGGPGVAALDPPGWIGASAPIFAVGSDTVSADLMLLAEPTVYGQPASVQITQPVLALTGFVSRDSNRSAVFSPQQLMMQGANVSIYIDSDDGLATLQTGDTATSQDQGIQLDRYGKAARLWSGASAVVEMLIAKARIAFGSLSWLELTSTLADLRGPSVRIGDGTSNVTITGNAMSGADLTNASNTFPSTFATTATAQTLTNKNMRSTTNTFPFKGGTTTITTDANGVGTIAHGLGVVPSFVVASTQGTTTYWCSVAAKTSTTFTVTVLGRDAPAVLASGSIPINWIVGL